MIASILSASFNYCCLLSSAFILCSCQISLTEIYASFQHIKRFLIYRQQEREQKKKISIRLRRWSLRLSGAKLNAEIINWRHLALAFINV